MIARLSYRFLAACLAGALLAGPAAALEPLAANKYINDRLIAARIADRVRRECPSLNARIVYAWGQAKELKKYAEAQGYSSAQIDAFLDSRSEKDRIYAVAEDYLRRNGARPGNPQSFCSVGTAEIANNTVTGSFLVAR